MRHEVRVDLMGTFARVRRELTPRSVGALAHVETILGNDAVIAADALVGVGAICRLSVLGPTRGDLIDLRHALPNVSINPIAVQECAAPTTSICLEDLKGERSWTFSRMPTLSADLPPFLYNRVYIDFYEEFDGAWPQLIVPPSAFVLGNLSQRSVESLPVRLPVTLNLAQISSPRRNVDYAFALCVEASCRYRCPVIVTLGSVGAVLVDPISGQGPRFLPATPIGTLDPLGVGAVFSAGILLADATAMDSIVEQAMLFVRQWLKRGSDGRSLGV